MRRLGDMWDSDPEAAARAATAVGYVLAAELRACGVDLSFTPVLDLDYGELQRHRRPRLSSRSARRHATGQER